MHSWDECQLANLPNFTGKIEPHAQSDIAY